MALDVHAYSLLHVGNPGDLEFYLDACGPEDTILELGCGFGRVGVALARRGGDVTGIDLDEGMVDAFNEAAVRAGVSDNARAVPGDMRTLKLGRRFDKVIIPFNGLLCMLSDDDVVSCLRAARAHLEADGEILFDMYHVPDWFGNDGDEDEAFEEMGLIEDEGHPVRAYERTFGSDDPQRFDTAYQLVYEEGPRKGEILEFAIPQRCIYLKDLESLLERADLNLVGVFPDFTDSKLDEHTGQVGVRARTLTAS